MCGIAGSLKLRGLAQNSNVEPIVAAMTAALSHRGPNAQGLWSDEAQGIALGHRRLSILDLSENGSQPMVSKSGRYIIVYNGEIYNYLDLKAAFFQGETFHGTSDTELMLCAMERWGVTGALNHFVGMFALAVWDRSQQTLILARDRVGKKPLYYSLHGQSLSFASELKALRQHPTFRPDINRKALAEYFRFAYIPSPASIYENTFKLPAASYITFDTRTGTLSDPVRYWRIAGDIQEKATLEESLYNLEIIAKNAVRQRMISDVPLGAFLSGGIDSTLVVALMQAESSRPVRTFTMGFEQSGFDEAEHAKSLAAYLGTDHTEYRVTPKEALAVIPLLPEIYDEPFADSSQIPTYLVSRLARRDVTVAMTGDGGDEIFGGYNRYFLCPPLWQRLKRVPRGFRKLIQFILANTPPNLRLAILRPFLQHQNLALLSEKVQKLVTIMDSPSPLVMYQRLVSTFQADEGIVLGIGQGLAPETTSADWQRSGSFTEKMMSADFTTYLPDDILVKVDRASMACSLECRAPLLDSRLIEFVSSLPLSVKLPDSQGKWLLKQLLFKYVPENMMARPKMGFSIPIGIWLRGPLRDWANDLFLSQQTISDGLLDIQMIKMKWQDHQSGKRDWQYQLWSLLMFLQWHRSIK